MSRPPGPASLWVLPPQAGRSVWAVDPLAVVKGHHLPGSSPLLSPALSCHQESAWPFLCDQFGCLGGGCQGPGGFKKEAHLPLWGWCGDSSVVVLVMQGRLLSQALLPPRAQGTGVCEPG